MTEDAEEPVSGVIMGTKKIFKNKFIAEKDSENEDK